MELVLALFSDLYSKLNSIFIDVSSTLLVHLILSTNYLTTNYCSKKNIQVTSGPVVQNFYTKDISILFNTIQLNNE